MKKLNILFLFILLFNNLFCQKIGDDFWGLSYCSNYRDDKYCYDSIKNYCYSLTTITTYKKEKTYKVYETVVEYGLYINRNRQGIWNLYDSKNNEIIAQWFYIDDKVYKEMQYDNGKLISVINYDIEYVEVKNEGDADYREKTIEIYSFNKRGKLIMHSKLQSDGLVKRETYKGKKTKTTVYDPTKMDSRGKPLKNKQ